MPDTRGRVSEGQTRKEAGGAPTSLTVRAVTSTVWDIDQGGGLILGKVILICKLESRSDITSKSRMTVVDSAV